MKSYDWMGMFVRFSAIMLWVHVIFSIAFIVYQPWREGFLDWIVWNNQDYFIEYLNWLLDNQTAPIAKDIEKLFQYI